MKAEKATNVDTNASHGHEDDDPKITQPWLVWRGQPSQLSGGLVKGDGSYQQAGEGADHHHSKIEPDDRVRAENSVDAGVRMQPGEVEEVGHHVGGVWIEDQPDNQEQPEGEGTAVIEALEVKAQLDRDVTQKGVKRHEVVGCLCEKL